MNRREFLKLSAASSIAAAISAALCGCASFPGGPSAVNVGSYNIRFVRGDTGTPNDWDERKDDLVDEIRALGMDVFGLQEVCPEQAEYITNALPQYALVGEFREADRKSGEASPVCFRKDRFAVDKSGTFWLSETPEEPGVKGWGAACPRVCSWALLKDRASGAMLCFANAHTDHVSELARKEGMLLVIRRMSDFAPTGTPIVFTGDHNCTEIEEPAKAVAGKLKNALYASETPPKGPWRTYTGWRYEANEYPCLEAMKLTEAERNALVAGEEVRYDARYACGGPRIDYIYVSEGVRVKSYETRADVRRGTALYPSDHFPVVAEIEIGR